MQRLDRILAVIDPTVDAQVGAAKAAQLARGTGAALELFTCDFDPSLSGAPFFDTEALRRLREEFVGRRAVVLDALAAEMRTTGLEVTTRVHWDNPLHAGILRRVAEWTPDLVVKDTHHHPPLKRTLLSNTDWTLIRACPVPLLLAKAAPWPAEPCIVAALDPGHRRDEPPALEGDILDATQLLARVLGGRVEAVHAFLPAVVLAATAGSVGLQVGADEIVAQAVEAERVRIAASIQAVAASRGLGRQQIHIVQGGAVEQLPRFAEERHATVLVMGGVTRSRLRDAIVGSTAERILDRMPCDILVVKPADFAATLPF
jgi:universal stress protein E